MTAPTPDLEAHLRALSSRATEGGMYEANETLLVGDMAAALIEAADTLAAVTAERDQAVENARASQQMHEQARSLLDQTLTERDQALADLLKETDHCRDTARALRQMTARWDQARQMLADAPHGYTIDSEARMVFCSSLTGETACNCWKAGL